MNESDDALEKAATIFMNNQFAKRVMDFCRGERPVKYDPDTTWKLIEKITHKDNDLTYRFYDGSEVFVSAEIFTGGKKQKMRPEKS